MITNLAERVEGTRLKHWHNGNSIKIYDKGSVLRPECTLRQPALQVSTGRRKGTRTVPSPYDRCARGSPDLQRRAEVTPGGR